MKSEKDFLENLAKRYSHKSYLTSDPIEFCYRYKSAEDIEIIGFISALFSYGNVLSIKNHLEKLFNLLGKHPFAFVMRGNFSKIEKEIPKYRFQTDKDNLIFLQALSSIIKKKTSLESLFHSENEDALLNERIVNFQKYFIAEVKDITGKSKLNYGLQFLIGSAILDSSNKRYCMFLRWMVRNSFPDFGIYKSIPKSSLLYPTDVHIVRLSRILGFSNRRTVDFRLAKSISEHFKEINPKDPLAYDFALSRLGILKICKSKYVSEICESCELKKICNIYNSI